MSVHADFHETLTMTEKRVIDALMKLREKGCGDAKTEADALRSVAFTAKLLSVAADEFADYVGKSHV